MPVFIKGKKLSKSSLDFFLIRNYKWVFQLGILNGRLDIWSWHPEELPSVLNGVNFSFSVM